jgi:L-ascorbate metabolism protein UlaG (beta-lactamase superfamily)
MKIFWLGHSCFYLQSSKGISLLTDPFDDEVGYRLPRVKADIVVVSHDHHDHNNVGIIKGNPEVVRGPGRHSIQGIDFWGIETWHDQKRGRLRGSNTVFRFALDGVRICHLGDLGHILEEKEVRAIGPIDLLFVPIGGIYTLDAKDAWTVVGQLHPRIVIPMHYLTPAISFELDGVEEFLRGRDFQGPLKSFEAVLEDILQEKGCRVVLLDYVHFTEEGSID